MIFEIVITALMIVSLIFSFAIIVLLVNLIQLLTDFFHDYDIMYRGRK